ncbi:MAG: capsular polysaccharide biosynthesis protein [Hyphomicrobiales bacterium]|nr:capsular polysaccharide biosynthesis protein [Hyphomicrobiales bacterium]
MSFRSTAINGVAWQLSAQAVRVIFQFATTVILARLLTPDDFGVFAMAMPVIGLAGLLQDFGLHDVVVQKETISSDEVNAIFWANLGITAIVALLLLAASPFVADFYGEQRLTPMLAAWSGILLLGALSFGQYSMLARAFRFKTLAKIDITCAVVSFVTVLVSAWFLRSYWALWLAGLTSVACFVTLTYVTGVWRPTRPRRDINLRGSFHFGGNIILHNAANYASRNIDNILVGKNFGGTVLGYYDRAYKLLLYPIENLANPIARVMVPVLSRLQKDEPGLRRAFLQAYGITNLVAIPGLAFAIGCASEIIAIMLGEKWMEVARIFQFLGIAGVAQPLINSASWLFISQNRTKALMYLSVSSSVVIVIGFFIGLRWGAVGVAAGYAAAEILYRAPLTCYLAGRINGAVRVSDLVASLVPLFVAAAATVLSIHYLREAGLQGLSLIFVSLIVAYVEAFLALSLLPSGREQIRATLRMARSGWMTISGFVTRKKSGQIPTG